MSPLGLRILRGAGWSRFPSVPGMHIGPASWKGMQFSQGVEVELGGPLPDPCRHSTEKASKLGTLSWFKGIPLTLGRASPVCPSRRRLSAVPVAGHLHWL